MILSARTKNNRGNHTMEQSSKTNPKPTIAQTQKALPLLFSTFDKTAFLPQKSKKGNRRTSETKIPKKYDTPLQKNSKRMTFFAIRPAINQSLDG